ncbi:ADP-ribose pyrophosphatase [Lachnospiraceae bacterium TWA4]|nr:ADP-ribose pyrophosphatase [Lachnospiraceae bacterium TWA4]
MDEIKRVNRTLKHKGAIVDFYSDTMQFPNGHSAEWDLIHHKGAAAVVAVLPDGKLLMVRQYRNALERYTLEIPAGALDTADEPKIECAARELEEETGYRCDHLKHLLDINTTVAFCDEFIGVYLAEDLVKTKQHLDEDEFLNVEAWELDDLITKIQNFEITDSKTIASIMAYKVYKDQK